MLYSETNLVKSFGRSIVNKYIDPALDVEETSVDSLLEDVILVEKIPVLKGICAPGKTVSVSDKFFCKRLVAFIQEFNNGNISQYKMDKHIDKLKEEKKLDPEYEQVLLLIEQCSQASQAKYLARFYQSYWNGDYDWDSFREIADANQRMFACDYAVLQSVASETESSGKESSVSRLVSLGLIVDRRSSGEGLSLSEFGIEFAKGLDAKKKTTRKSSAGAKKPSINEDLFSGRLFDSEKTGEPKPAATEAPDPNMFKNMDIDDAFALLAAAPSPFKPLDSEPAETTRAKIAPDAPKAKPEPEVSNAKLVTEAPKTRPGTEAKPKSKSTPKPAFDPKDTSQMGVKQLRPIINTDNDSPYASSPMASDGSSPFKPAKSKKIEADAPKTRSTRSKAAAEPANIPDDNNPFRAAANSESKTPKSAENSPFKPIGAPGLVETPSPFKPAAPKAEPAAKAAEPSPFKPAPAKKTSSKAAAEPAEIIEDNNPFRAAANSESKVPKSAEPASPFKPAAVKAEPAAKAAEPSPFKPAPAKKTPAAPAKESAEPSPFKPLGSAPAAKAAEPSPFKPAAVKAEPAAKAAEPSPFKPAPAKKTPAAPAKESAEPSPFKPLGSAPAAPKAAEPSPFKPAAVKAEPAAKAAEPSPFKPAPEKKTSAPTPAAKASEPSPFKPLGSTEAPKAAEPASPFKPLGSAEAPKTQEPASPFKPFGAAAKTDAPAAETASAAPFKPFSNISQDPPVHIEAANPNMFNMGSVSHPNSDSPKGTSKLGSFMSMDDDEVLHQDKETGKLGSYMSLDEGEDTGEKLPQRSESSTNYFAMSSASSAPSRLSSSNASPFKPMKPADSGSAPKSANPSPFKPADASNPEGGAPAHPSPFKPLGS